jgi:hypothetical protein
MNIKVAESIDLMTLPKMKHFECIDEAPIKHICWVETNDERVQPDVAGAKDKFAGC